MLSDSFGDLSDRFLMLSDSFGDLSDRFLMLSDTFDDLSDSFLVLSDSFSNISDTFTNSSDKTCKNQSFTDSLNIPSFSTRRTASLNRSSLTNKPTRI